MSELTISKEMQEKINHFAAEQSQHYLNAAEMTYLEKLRRKSRQTKKKIGAKLARFRVNSAQAAEAKDDMLLYMNDYMNDLLAQGFDEQTAFERAKEELSATEETSSASGLGELFQQRLERHYLNADLDEMEMVGLLYGGFTVLGLTLGAVSGFLLAGGRGAFLGGGWIDTAIGAGAGLMIGVGLALIGNGIIAGKHR